jgi:hypothetical protein
MSIVCRVLVLNSPRTSLVNRASVAVNHWRRALSAALLTSSLILMDSDDPMPGILRRSISNAITRGFHMSTFRLKLSVGGICPPDLLEIEGLLTQGSRRHRTVCESVGGTFETGSSDWSNRIRHHSFDTRPDLSLTCDPSCWIRWVGLWSFSDRNGSGSALVRPCR